MRVFVLGSTGMLGGYVTRYLKAIGVTREQVDANIIRDDLFRNQFKKLNVKDGDVVINLVGITNKQNKHPWEFITVNSLFPRLLADYCDKVGAKMIHISTNCVFSGAEGNYSESDPHDDENIYGISKSAGEPNNCTVIRTSIVGENKGNNMDLLEWVRKHKNDVIDGYIDHHWNGITCLQFAKVCEKIINTSNYWRGVRHVFSPQPITKANLVEMISDVYDLNNVVRKKDSERFCDRTLVSNYSAYFDIPPIYEQLIEQRDFVW